MIAEIAYQKIANIHFEERRIVTIKKAGSTWGSDEIASDMARVDIDITEELFNDINENIYRFKVNDIENPSSIIGV